jgi:hypothetical protein
MYIACPKCDWRPEPDNAWECECGHVWNTFETCGVCPVCEHEWDDTICPACMQSSSHEDWYHFDNDLTVADYVANPSLIRTWPTT